jgi:hypothetical protein
MVCTLKEITLGPLVGSRFSREEDGQFYRPSLSSVPYHLFQKIAVKSRISHGANEES